MKSQTLYDEWVRLQDLKDDMKPLEWEALERRLKEISYELNHHELSIAKLRFKLNDLLSYWEQK